MATYYGTYKYLIQTLDLGCAVSKITVLVSHTRPENRSQKIDENLKINKKIKHRSPSWREWLNGSHLPKRALNACPSSVEEACVLILETGI